MNEEHSTDNNRKTMESAFGAIPAEPMPQDKLSRLVKDAMASPDGGGFFKNILRDEFEVTPENVVWFLNYTQQHSEESTKLDAYNLIRARINLDIALDFVKYILHDTPICQELLELLLSHTESLLEYGKKLARRQKAIDNLSHSIDLIADPAVKEAVSQQYENLLDVHEEITCHRYAIEELRLKVEKEKWKHSQTTLCEQDDPLLEEIAEIGNNMASLFQSAINQEEKLKQWEGDYPEGLRTLGEMAYKDVSEKISHILIRLNKAGIKDIDEDIFYARFVFNQSLSKIANDLAKKRNWHRDRSTISRRITNIKQKLKKAGINSNMILEIKKSAKIE